MFKSWDKVEIETEFGKKEAVAPIIISASRSTDIPAFYSNWFIKRINEGYVKWINPFNQKPLHVSFDKARVIVFWTKNAAPMLKHLDELDKKGINYYFTFTINDYVEEGLEPNVPPIADRIETFQKLSKRIGKGRVIWRFDPLILSKALTVDKLLNKLKSIGDQLYQYTDKLVISFADINIYSRVLNNLTKFKQDFREFGPDECNSIAAGLREFNKKWGITIATCSEKIDLKKYGIIHNKCVDDDLMIKEFPKDGSLMDFLGVDRQGSLLDFDNKRPNLKDKGQRKECGCIISKDIGQYNTCGHLCLYCYANHSAKQAQDNMKKHKDDGEMIV
jgi:DNA repair photolyase